MSCSITSSPGLSRVNATTESEGLDPSRIPTLTELVAPGDPAGNGAQRHTPHPLPGDRGTGPEPRSKTGTAHADSAPYTPERLAGSSTDGSTGPHPAPGQAAASVGAVPDLDEARVATLVEVLLEERITQLREEITAHILAELRRQRHELEETPSAGHARTQRTRGER